MALYLKHQPCKGFASRTKVHHLPLIGDFDTICPLDSRLLLEAVPESSHCCRKVGADGNDHIVDLRKFGAGEGSTGGVTVRLNIRLEDLKLQC